jgi:TetR/AcrR family fatty acid metabolism transcriptional regulator
MPAITAERSQQRFNLILEAATEVFAERGFEGSSIVEVASRAGISEGLIYKYFRDKRALLAQVLSSFNTRTMDELEAEVALHETFREKLEVVLAHRLRSIAQYPGLTRLYVSQVRSASDEPGLDVRSLSRRAARMWSKMCAEALARGEIRPGLPLDVIRDAIWGALEHLAWIQTSGRARTSPEHTARGLAEFYLCGMQGSPTRGKASGKRS